MTVEKRGSMPLALGVGVGVVLLLAALLWREHQDVGALRGEIRALRSRSGILETELSRAGKSLEEARASVAESERQLLAARQAAGNVKPDAVQAALQPPVDSNAFSLVKQEIRATDGGYTATLTLSAGTVDRAESAAIVVRIPRDSRSRILEFKPVDGAMYSNVAARVSEDGLFAFFEGRPASYMNLMFQLRVSGPVKATVHANCGLDPFELSIGN